MQRHCVSAVVPVRHDNWGGGLALRAQTTLPHLAAAFDELLLVDFNSQNGTLLSTLALPQLPRLRSVVVDRSLCSSLWPTPGGCGPDSFSTVLARNLGVERSSCDVVVSKDRRVQCGREGGDRSARRTRRPPQRRRRLRTLGGGGEFVRGGRGALSACEHVVWWGGERGAEESVR